MCGVKRSGDKQQTVVRDDRFAVLFRPHENILALPDPRQGIAHDHTDERGRALVADFSVHRQDKDRRHDKGDGQELDGPETERNGALENSIEDPADAANHDQHRNDLNNISPPHECPPHGKINNAAHYRRRSGKSQSHQHDGQRLRRENTSFTGHGILV
jgi:hypothetical protein